MSSARVLVTDASRGSAIAVIRSLGRRGLHVIAADHEPRSPGFRSRHAAERLVYPDPVADPAAVVDLLHAQAAAGSIDLIIPITEELMLPLAAARERFAGLCELAIPADEALLQVADKDATVELAKRLGVPVPRSALVATVDEALAAAPDLGWPLVLKPVSSRVVHDDSVEIFTVGYADGPSALVEAMLRLQGRCEVLLQEYHAGEGHGVELLAERGRVLMSFQHRRLHEVPITGGASSLRESVSVDPLLLDHASRLIEALHWTGLAMVEFRVGPDGPALMEINGRIWGSLPLAVKSGVDFPAGLARLHLGTRLNGAGEAISDTARIGVRSRNLTLELTWIASVLRRERRYPYLDAPPRRAGLRAALRLVLPRDGYDVLSREDPAPGVSDALRAARRFAAKVVRGGS